MSDSNPKAADTASKTAAKKKTTLVRLIGLVRPYPLVVATALLALAAATAADVSTPLVMQSILDRFILNGELAQDARFSGISRGALLFGLLLAVNLAGSFFQIYLTTRLSQGVMKDLRLRLFSHLLGQTLASLEAQPVGTLVSRVTSDVETVNEFFTSVASALLKDVSLMAGVLTALFILDPLLAGITLLTLPPVVLLALFFRVRARRAFRRVRESVSQLNRYLSEHISGMEVVQMFGQEERSRREFRRENGDWQGASLLQMYTFAVFRPLVDWLSTFSIAAVILAGAGFLGRGWVTLGVMIAFINLIQKFYNPIKDLSEKFNILQSALAGGERVFEMLDTDVRLPETPQLPKAPQLPEGQPADPAEAVPADAAAPAAAAVETAVETAAETASETASETAAETLPAGRVDFSAVDFSYVPGQPILQDLSFTLEPGTTTAVVGFTGAGKTTIAALLARLWDIQGGSIALDGRDIRSYPLKDLRRAVQPVAQEVFLFSGTIRDNITLGRPFPPEEVEQAARTVRAHPFIARLPRGYDTPLNEGGQNLSSGQRQLLSFARVILHDPRVIILDEATSSIDTQTEALIQEAMTRLLQNRTSLVIAHRLSTIRHADRILVLHQGRLVESGTHDELLAQEGRYRALYELQYSRQTGKT